MALLHNIRSLYNVGSIFRTADGAGVTKLYLCGITPAPLDKFDKPRPQLTKVSLGAEKFVPWEKHVQTGKLINRLKKAGYKIIALEQNKKSLPYGKFNNSNRQVKKNKPSKAALVVGNEVRGLPQSILDQCDQIMEIPMRGRKESLNVAVAFGIAVYTITRG